MAKQALQLEFGMDLCFRVPITRSFVSNREYFDRLKAIAESGQRVTVIEVVNNGYKITTTTVCQHKKSGS